MADEEAKAILKEALREWLDEKFTQFGKWSLAALGSATIAGITYLMLMANGWHK